MTDLDILRAFPMQYGRSTNARLLSRQLGVAYDVVRDAMRRLSADGYIEFVGLSVNASGELCDGFKVTKAGWDKANVSDSLVRGG